MKMSVALLSALSLFACGDDSKTPATETSQKVGTLATDVSATDMDGKTVRLSSYLGKNVVLLNFWATWCDPCKAEMPHLRRLYDENKDKGFVLVGISMDGPETVQGVRDVVKSYNLAYPIWLDQDSSIASVYNPRKSPPLSVLIDKAGKVVKVHEGYNAGDEDVLRAEVEAALK